MKKIKSMFEKHDLFKIVLLAIFVTILLTWLVPYGQIASGTYTKVDFARQGFSDILLSGVYSGSLFIQQLVFVIFIGMFYGILSQVSGYKALVNKIADKLKGKEKLFVIVSSLVVALLTSVLSQVFVVLLFIPFIINIASKLKLDKITTFLCSFGAMIVGVLGATYGTDGLTSFIYYLNYYEAVTITEEIAIRFGVLALAFVLYSFFMMQHMNKVNKKEEKVEDLFVVSDEKSKKTKVWPMAILLGILSLFVILGYINWVDNFNLNIFTKFHTWLTGLKIGDYTIFSYILGANAKAFGTWDLYLITVVMAIVLFIAVIGYRTKIDEVLDSALEGIKNIIKPVILLVMVYSIFVFVYWCPFTVTICNWITNLVSGFNPFIASISAFVSALFHIDFGYAGYVLGDILATTYNEFFHLAILIYSTINGLVQFVAPSSVLLVFGLSYLNLSYKNWLKYIWKFVLVMLALLILIFALLTYV